MGNPICSTAVTTRLTTFISFESPEEEAAHYRREYSWIRDALQHAKAELGETVMAV